MILMAVQEGREKMKEILSFLLMDGSMPSNVGTFYSPGISHPLFQPALIFIIPNFIQYEKLCLGLHDHMCQS